MAKDLFHNKVKIALQKDGWKITHDPYQLRYGVADVYPSFVTLGECNSRKAYGALISIFCLGILVFIRK